MKVIKGNNMHQNMANPFAFLPLLLFALTLLPFSSSRPVPPPLETFIHGGCSPTSSPNSSFAADLNALLTSLLNSSTHSSYTHLSQNDAVYGLYQCRGDISPRRCTSCVARSAAHLTAMCPSSSSAAVQLQGCYLRYDNASFHGTEDLNVVFKKFGGVKSTATGRDEVLSGLVRSQSKGTYRVVESKGVVGRAQCTGDLSVEGCQGCVETAVKLLKKEYGNSGDGGMFLGKCYARYSCFGGGGQSQSGSSSNDGVKTFALIAGSLAGIVVLIIFFTFICREFAGSDK